ncbi:MAG: metallo-mystery pair system four-Cys motif protein [Deltaproteobacteria bacterium]|nr:metallo-mystery pair system four-Cys motif protein [Deltaproteobacteria bacterium]
MKRVTMLFLGASPLFACGGEDHDHAPGDHQEPVAIQFSALVGDRPFACGQTYQGVGTSQSTLEPLDFKLYIHDPQLIRSNGERVPLALIQDGVWQRERVSLLDFEDGTGLCQTGSPGIHTTIDGLAPDFGDYVGVELSIGLPPEMNHLDAATAPAPLSAPGMWWSWSGGFKYLRLDAKTRGNAAYYLHLGATDCEGTPATGFSCQAGNVPKVVLMGFDMGRSQVKIDVARLWSGVDLDAQIDGVTDFVPGCMSFSGDPECPAVFQKLGLAFGASAAGEQSAFEVQ